MPGWAPHCPFLAAAAAIALAATGAPIAAAAQQQDQDDDPTHIAATETVIATEVTHTNTSKFLIRLFDAAHSMVFRRADLVQHFRIVDNCR